MVIMLTLTIVAISTINHYTTTLVNMEVLYAEVPVALITVPLANGEACTAYSNWLVII